MTFGTVDNYRTENLTFEVGELNLPYNAVLGRPALCHFMVMLHYVYNILKMPSPNGIITE